MEFIVYLISSLQRDSKITGKSATQVLLEIDRQTIDVSSMNSLHDRLFHSQTHLVLLTILFA